MPSLVLTVFIPWSPWSWTEVFVAGSVAANPAKGIAAAAPTAAAAFKSSRRVAVLRDRLRERASSSHPGGYCGFLRVMVGSLVWRNDRSVACDCIPSIHNARRELHQTT